jgi:DNA-binding PadR family transcriptional regulator
MSLDHAILGFINERPRSGYDLKKAFDATVAHIWPAKQSQIYLTLARLTDQKLVTVEVIHQDDKPNRKVYHITESGLNELRRWLASPLPLSPWRDAFLVQLAWADAITVPELVALVEAWAASHQKRLDGCRNMLDKLKNDPPKGEWDRVLLPLIAEQLAMVEETHLSWAEMALDRIKGLRPLDAQADEREAGVSDD